MRRSVSQAHAFHAVYRLTGESHLHSRSDKHRHLTMQCIDLHVLVFIRMYLHLHVFACLSVRQSASQPVSQSVSQSVCLPVGLSLVRP